MKGDEARGGCEGRAMEAGSYDPPHTAESRPRKHVCEENRARKPETASHTAACPTSGRRLELEPGRSGAEMEAAPRALMHFASAGSIVIAHLHLPLRQIRRFPQKIRGCFARSIGSSRIAAWSLSPSADSPSPSPASSHSPSPSPSPSSESNSSSSPSSPSRSFPSSAQSSNSSSPSSCKSSRPLPWDPAALGGARGRHERLIRCFFLATKSS